MPRSASRSSTFRKLSGNRTYIITTKRMISGHELKYQNGLVGLLGLGMTLPYPIRRVPLASAFALTVPKFRLHHDFAKMSMQCVFVCQLFTSMQYVQEINGKYNRTKEANRDREIPTSDSFAIMLHCGISGEQWSSGSPTPFCDCTGASASAPTSAPTSGARAKVDRQAHL